MKPVARFLLFAGLFTSHVAHATSTLSFTGGKFEIEIVISDTSNEIANVRLYDGNSLVLVAEAKDLEAARCDPEKRTLSLIMPAKGHAPRLTLVARGRKGRMIYGTRSVRLRCDWSR